MRKQNRKNPVFELQHVRIMCHPATENSNASFKAEVHD